MGTLQFSTAVAMTNFESSLTIVAERGTIKVGGQYMNEVEYCYALKVTKCLFYPLQTRPTITVQYKGSAANHGYVFDNVLDTLRGSGRITTNALEGLKSGGHH